MKLEKNSTHQTKQSERTFIPLRNDYVFTQTMKNTTVLRGFLAAVLGMNADDIQEITVKDRHLKKAYLDGKLAILDVRAYVVNIGDIDIEIQLKEHRYWDERSIFYSSLMYVENVDEGTGYEQCNKVISITILGFNHCKDTDYFYSCFHLREDKRYTLLSDVLEFHIIELTKLDCVVEKKDQELHKWARLIAAESEEQRMEIEKDPYIEEALKELEEIKNDPERVHEYILRDIAIRDHVTFMEDAKIEGRREGLEEGRRDGLEEGRRDGLEKGEERLTKLIQILMKNNEIEKIKEITVNKQLRLELLQKYHLL